MRSISLLFILATISGCGSNCLGDKTAEDGITPPVTDGTSSTETTPEARLTVDYTSAWSAAVPFTAEIGDEVNFGAIVFGSVTGAEIEVSTTAVQLWINVNGDSFYHLGTESGVEAKNFVGNCRLTDATTYEEYSAASIDNGGRLVFSDGFTVGGEYTTAANVRCTLTGEVPLGQTYGLAVDINHGEQAVIASADGGATLVPVDYGVTNGTQSGMDIVPQVAVLIDNPCAFDVAMAGGGIVTLHNEISVALSHASPSGNVDFNECANLEVLRPEWTVVHPECPALIVHNPTIMGLWTDMAGSSWSPSNLSALDLEDGESFGLGVVENRGGMLYAYFDVGFIIEGGMTRSVAFSADVCGGSTEMDDSFRFDLPEMTVTVSEDGVTMYTIANPTISGGTQVL